MADETTTPINEPAVLSTPVSRGLSTLMEAVEETLAGSTDTPKRAPASSTSTDDAPSHETKPAEASGKESVGRAEPAERTGSAARDGDSDASASDTPRAESAKPFKAFQSEEELKSFIRSQSNRDWDKQQAENARLLRDLKAAQLTAETLSRTVAKAKTATPQFIRDVAEAARQGVDGADIYRHADQFLNPSQWEQEAMREAEEAHRQREAQEGVAQQRAEQEQAALARFAAEKEAATKPLYLETRAALLEEALPVGVGRDTLDELIKEAWQDEDVRELMADWEAERDLAKAEKLAQRTYKTLKRVTAAKVQEKAVAALEPRTPRPDRTTAHGTDMGVRDTDPLRSVPFKDRGRTRLTDAFADDFKNVRI